MYAYDLPWGWGDVEEALSVAVVETDEATVLFGTGDDSTADDLRPLVEAHDVDVAVAEHGDIDHFGGIPALDEAFDLTVAIPAGDTQFLDDAGVHYDVEMQAGETYWGFETVGVPGHTPDNMAYLYDDVLLAGDAVCGSDSAFAMDGDWPGALAPLADDFNYDTPQTLESVSLLTGYGVEIVLTAHGQNVLENGEDELEMLAQAIEAMD